MMKGIKGFGAKITLTVIALGGLGTGLMVNELPSAQSYDSLSEIPANCYSTAVRICRSEVVDSTTGTVISISRLARN